MRIYLDSKDIIEILEKSKPCSAIGFKEFLQSGNHELILSFVTVMEISEPLLHKKASTNVMRLLNQLEDLPHLFIHSSRITLLELQQAYNSFCSDIEYKDVDIPFEKRFDTVVDLNGQPSTSPYLNYPLAETVWDLYNFNALGGLDNYASKLISSFEADRAIKPRPKLKENFQKTVGLNSRQNQLEIPMQDIKPLANWIYSNPNRCPSDRLGYELWHKMIRNLEDIPTPSDLEDFHNIGCLPYVDIMTLDRRMHGYVCQVSNSLNVNYDQKIFRNTNEFMKQM
ncbi:MAG: hypothetical protein KKE44_15285 [Proteobacteria bacterium]|nr:hypothetical protein [Pseudomonadota bacterium]MBU1584092.1 hypothetical protein [Pseudomonadota bacterium]MBU2454125.1 hypothetical protein [Pseudomonadota bacterium]MBU2630853.1 hypothetical protein [Pseudomonadota bacterium]